MSICATIRRPEECPPGLVTIDHRFAMHKRISAGGGKLSAPVLAVDGQFGFRGNPETMARVADNVRSVVIPNPGHWVAEEQPAALLAEVIPFLAG